MQTLVQVKDRDTGGIVEIMLQNGNLFRISFEDAGNCIRVNTVDGSMSIMPSVSNEVRIITNPNS